jgi:PEP-CTERM motif
MLGVRRAYLILLAVVALIFANYGTSWAVVVDGYVEGIITTGTVPASFGTAIFGSFQYDIDLAPPDVSTGPSAGTFALYDDLNLPGAGLWMRGAFTIDGITRSSYLAGSNGTDHRSMVIQDDGRFGISMITQGPDSVGDGREFFLIIDIPITDVFQNSGFDIPTSLIWSGGFDPAHPNQNGGGLALWGSKSEATKVWHFAPTYLSLSMAAIPEPGTLAIFALGLVVLVLMRRRRRH